MIEKNHKSDLIKSTLVLYGKIKVIYLIDGTKIKVQWDENNSPSLIIEETPQYTTKD